MEPPSTRTTSPSARFVALWLPALVCALAGAAVFAFFGNATRGYIDTRSVFWWWGAQWLNPASDTQHGPLVLLVSVWLFWRNLKVEAGVPTAWFGELQKRSGRPLPLWQPLAAMLCALVLHLLGYVMQQTRLSIVALLVFAWGVLALFGGRRWARAAVFPLGFMLLAIPLGFLDTLGFYLRLGVVNATSGLMHVVGVAVTRNGTQLFSPDGRYQYDVAAACSGIRSLVALLALALLVGYLRLKTFPRRALLVALCVPFVFFGNVLRISLIVLAGDWFGQKAGESVHDWSGWLVFVVVFLLLLAAAKILGKPASVSGSADIPVGEAPPKKTTSFTPAIAVIVLAASCLTAWATIRIDALATTAQTAIRLAPDGINPAPLPESFSANGNTWKWDGIPTAVTSVERDILPADTGFARRNYFNSANPLYDQVFFSIVLSGRDRTSIHRPELCLLGQGYTILSRSVETLTLANNEKLTVTILRIETQIPFLVPPGSPARYGPVHSLLAYWFAGSDTTVPTYPQMLLRSATDRLLRLRANRWAYFIAQTTDNAPAARARLLSVISALWPQIRAAKPQSPQAVVK